MESELKPCPNPWCESFDRGDEFTPYVTRIHFDNWQVKCPMCFMTVSYTHLTLPTKRIV